MYASASPVIVFVQRCWCREVGIYFLLLEWRIMAETLEKNILRVIKSVSCATLLSRYRSKGFEFSDKALLILLA